MLKNPINFGDVLTCAETGKPFVAAKDGITVNYAYDREGNIYSDEGVNIRERQAMLDRSGPYFCYISNDSRNVTGFKGNILGDITRDTPCRLTRRSYTHGKEYSAIRVQDVHGNNWYGRGSPGVCVTLRPCK